MNDEKKRINDHCICGEEIPQWFPNEGDRQYWYEKHNHQRHPVEPPPAEPPTQCTAPPDTDCCVLNCSCNGPFTKAAPHPEYGPCDAIANGQCAECIRRGLIAPAPSGEPPVKHRNDTTNTMFICAKWKVLEDGCVARCDKDHGHADEWHSDSVIGIGWRVDEPVESSPVDIKAPSGEPHTQWCCDGNADGTDHAAGCRFNLNAASKCPPPESSPADIKDAARKWYRSEKVFQMRWKNSHPDSLMSQEDQQVALLAAFAEHLREGK